MRMALGISDFLTMRSRDLRAALVGGHPVDPAAIENREYHGIALGLPRWIERLTWKKFTKTFHRDPETGALRGWNVRVVQTPLDDPAWEPQRRNDAPVTFGYYEVIPGEGVRMPLPAQHGLLIHYGLGGNPLWEAFGRARDPLVAVNAGSSELLLGWTYMDWGFVRVGTPSFFLLKRGPELGHLARPPRAPRRE